MNMLDWARREIEIAKKKERGDIPEGEWDYGCACYDSAFKAFKSLCEDEHSGTSISITQRILNRLIDGKCLTPIEDTDDEWKQIRGKKWQCKRYSALFKTQNSDGTYSYDDLNRSILQLGDGTRWHSWRASKYVNEKFPISFPYMPADRPYIVVGEEFYYKNPDTVGEYDHLALLELVYPDGTKEPIEKFYAEIDEGMQEITSYEYYMHKKETFK